MIRTREEIKELARNIGNCVLIAVMEDFPTVKKTIDKVDDAKWQRMADDVENEIQKILLNKFGSSD